MASSARSARTTHAAPERGNRFVVDASALAKEVGVEDHAPALQEWMVAARLANADLLAPPLLRYEIGHFLSRRADLAPEQRERALREMLLGFRFTDGLDAFRFAPPLTYYDAAYLAAAVSLKAVLVSYDQVLLDAARQAGLRTSSPGLDA